MPDDPQPQPSDELPYGVLESADLVGGDFYLPEFPDKIVPVAVLTLMFHPYDRLTAEPVGIRLILEAGDVGIITAALTEQAEALLHPDQEDSV